MAIVTAFALLLHLLEYWVDLISKSTSEVSKRASEQKRKMTVAGEPHQRKLSVVCKADTDRAKASFGVVKPLRE